MHASGLIFLIATTAVSATAFSADAATKKSKDHPMAMAADAKAMASDSKAMASDADMIASAMRAAPAKVGEKATIVAMGADGTMRTLRQGSNGFTCMPDNPETPGPDSMCMDK